MYIEGKAVFMRSEPNGEQSLSTYSKAEVEEIYTAAQIADLELGQPVLIIGRRIHNITICITALGRDELVATDPTTLPVSKPKS